jgi:hypothetical protein
MKRLILAAFLLATPAMAQEQVSCFPVPDLAKVLADKHAELPAVEGVATDGKMRLVLFANPETGTWTAVTIRPNGLGCLEMSGNGFELARPKPVGQES